jgi:hypothetical protein
MATLLLLAFEARRYEDARNLSVQSHEPCGHLEMGQKGREVNRRRRFAQGVQAARRPIFRQAGRGDPGGAAASANQCGRRRLSQ